MQYLLLYLGQKNCFVLMQSPIEELNGILTLTCCPTLSFSECNHFQLLNGRYRWSFKCAGSISGTPRRLEIPIIFFSLSTFQFNRSGQHGHVSSFFILRYRPETYSSKMRDENYKTFHLMLRGEHLRSLIAENLLPFY